MQRGLRIAGIVQHCCAEADRFSVKGLSRAGGEMDSRVVHRQCWTAQVDLIGETQERQREIASRTQVEEHSADLAALELRESEAIHLLGVGIAPQQALFEIGEAIVFLS